MARNDFKLIENKDEIINNVRVFMGFLESKTINDVLQNSKKFDFWYYFADLKIFIPNLVLGYKNGAYLLNNPTRGDTNGTDARKKLEKYFDDVSKNEIPSLYKELKNFTDKYGLEIKNGIITFYVPKEPKDFINLSPIIKEINREKQQTKTKKNVRINQCETIFLDELIDNIIKVKIGLRVLAKVLIPYVSKGLVNELGNNWFKKGVENILHGEQYDGLNEQKLDVSICLTLLDIHWDAIFKKHFKGKDIQKLARSYINELKVNRNINAHDGIYDISYDDAFRALDTMSRLCNALGEKEASNTIKNIIETLKKQS